MTVYVRAAVQVKHSELIPFITYTNAMVRRLYEQFDIQLLNGFYNLSGASLIDRVVPVENWWMAPSREAWGQAWAEAMQWETFQKIGPTIHVPPPDADGNPQSPIQSTFYDLTSYGSRPMSPSLRPVPEGQPLLIAADDGRLYRVTPEDYGSAFAEEYLDATQGGMLIDQGVTLAAIPESTLPVRGTVCYLVNLVNLKKLQKLDG